MRILVTNDDGIDFSGISKLASIAQQFGEVVVVAPEKQCSAMSHRITLGKGLTVTKRDFAVPGVTAYSVSGTPADCVRVGLIYLKLKPDYVFSGINCGYNSGFDTVYSGTVAAAAEAVMNKCPAIAFSTDFGEKYDAVDRFLPGVIDGILMKEPLDSQIWNINVPGCAPEDVKGVMYDRELARHGFIYDDFKEVSRESDDKVNIIEVPIFAKTADKGSDIEALMAGYVSVGRITAVSR